jgi:hypothetical protein
MNTSEKTCFKCLCVKPLSEFYKHKMMADGHLNKCKDCAKADVLRHRAENIERVQEYDRSRGMLPHRVAARAEYAKTEAYKNSVKESRKRRYEENKEKRRTIKLVCQRSREAGKLSRTPKWLSAADKALIRARYAEARWMTARTGIKHHVDHIVPLLGKSVSGLHVPWNLRVIPQRENAKKSNKFME